MQQAQRSSLGPATQSGPSADKYRPLRAADTRIFCQKVLNAPPASALWKMSLAANHRISLDLDLGVGNRQRRNGDQSAAREVIAEYFPADLGEAKTFL